MSEHYNVQVSVQRVVKHESSKSFGGSYRSPAEKEADEAAKMGLAREIVKVMDVSVVADTELEAYNKAIRLLQVNMPELTVGEPRKLGRPIRDNPQA